MTFFPLVSRETFGTLRSNTGTTMRTSRNNRFNKQNRNFARALHSRGGRAVFARLPAAACQISLFLRKGKGRNFISLSERAVDLGRKYIKVGKVCT